ncbi:CLUMA_CG013942, isoform B [Clunio marinus]|uniref:CLUMA_CG013942, isoform B n=1 Tax=Clunio marinus TaxID=568069 RepID=A0A1J1IM93_9DIPT|nr:CLUMA_CG013942, isoform B [Clunio marinus]
MDMIMPSSPSVDAARDLKYCPTDEQQSTTPQAAPRIAAPKYPPRPKPRSVLPPTTSTSKATKLEDICKKIDEEDSSSSSSIVTNSSLPSRRLIKADFSLFKDDETSSTASEDAQSCRPESSGDESVTYRRNNNENNQNNINTILRRTTYDLATQCESRRASIRRHTIVGCQNFKMGESQSVPPSRPNSRQSTEQSKPPQPVLVSSQVKAPTPQINQATNLNSMDQWSKNSLDEHQWRDKLESDRLSLTLEEIVHIRSVITKAELESLPVGIHIKEDVEKRKLCFLCLRTKFGLLSSRGIPCKLCQRTVCAKCYTKMRIPIEHFSNVPVQLLSPSLQSSPTISNAPSPNHHGGMDESFPRSLMERLLRTDVDRKSRNTVGSAPSSPKNQRSTSSTPGSSQPNSLCTINNGVSSSNTMTTSQLSAKDNQISLRNSIMSRSMEGPRSLPPQSPAKTHSNCSTLDRRSGFKKAFTLMQQQQCEQKECLRGELMAVCNDCRGLVLNIIRYSRQTRSSARNHALKNLTLDLSPVYKR